MRMCACIHQYIDTCILYYICIHAHMYINIKSAPRSSRTCALALPSHFLPKSVLKLLDKFVVDMSVCHTYHRCMTHSTLPSPYGSAPSHPAKYVIYCDLDRKDIVLVYAQLYACSIFLDHIIPEGTEYEEVAPDLIVTDDGVTIRAPHLDEMLDYTPTFRESLWELPLMELNAVNYLLHGEYKEPQYNAFTKRPPKISKSQRSNYHGIPELAVQLNLSRQQTRSLLRRSNITKSEVGWQWLKKEFPQIVEQLKSEQ